MRLVASQRQLEGGQKLKDPGDGSGTSGEEGRFDRASEGTSPPLPGSMMCSEVLRTWEADDGKGIPRALLPAQDKIKLPEWLRGMGFKLLSSS